MLTPLTILSRDQGRIWRPAPDDDGQGSLARRARDAAAWLRRRIALRDRPAVLRPARSRRA